MKKIFKKILVYILIGGILFQGTGVYALTKDENVYVKLNEKGKVQSSSITEHLYDYNGKEINDKSILSNIKNINGNGKLVQKGNDLVWETNGSDIYYQGTYDKNLPINLEVKYYLNGEEKNVNEMLGKKGSVKISLTYKNNLYEHMIINGKKERLYVPYGVVTTTILNNKDNKNINVTNGKIIDNGVSSVVMAISSPGLYESLKIDDLKDISHVDIMYDTESFELNTIYSVATTSLFSDNNLDIFGEVNDLYKNINLLQTNMDTIVEASKKLNDGTSQIDKGITELNNRIQELTNKYRYYRNQDKNVLRAELVKLVEKNINMITPTLEEEITNETSKLIKENKKKLEEAVITYTKKNTKMVVDEEVNKIVSELDFDKLIEKVINSNLYNLLKNDKEIESLTSMLKEDINKELKSVVLSEFNKINSSLDNNMSEVAKEDVNYIIEKYGLSEDDAKSIVNKVQVDTLNQVKKNVSDANITDKIINTLNDEKYVSKLVNDYVTKLNNKINESLNNDSTILDYSKDIKDKIVLSIKKDLEENHLYLNDDVKNYIPNLVDKIVDNTAKDLSSKYTESYTNEVVKSIIEKQFSSDNVDSKLGELLDRYEDDINQKALVLDNSIDTLSEALKQLNNGSNQIANGMNKLSDGLDKYNKQGINKINSLVNGDVKTLQKRMDALIKLSNKYKTIDSVPTNAKNNSKIIFMIDSVSKTNEVKVVEPVKETKRTIWDKIKGLFN